MCVCAQRTGQSDQFKTVKSTDFKFEGGICKIHKSLCGDMHSHEHLLVFVLLVLYVNFFTF